MRYLRAQRQEGFISVIAWCSLIGIALGVALAGGILEGVAMFSGDTLGATAFAIAFVLVGLVTSLAALPFLALPPDAGSTVSGHRSSGVNSRSQVVPAK